MFTIETSLIPPDQASIVPENFPAFLNSYPLALRGRYTKESLDFRAKLDTFIRELLLSRKKYVPTTSEEIGASLLSTNMLLPQHVECLEQTFDCIACVLADRNNQTATIIMENPSYGNPDGVLKHHETGVGKTSLALALLEAPIFFDKLPPFIPTRLAKDTDFTPVVVSSKTPNGNLKIVSLDITYAGHSDGKLVTTPIVGVEGIDGQSDIAVSATRAKTAAVGIAYDRRAVDVSKYFTACAKHTFLDSNLFVSKDELLPITSLIVINLVKNEFISQKQKNELSQKGSHVTSVESSSWVALEEVEEQYAPSIALNAFRTNPLYHPSPMWAVNSEHHLATIENVRDMLPKKVAFLYIYPGENGYTPANATPIFQEGARLIRDWMTS